MSQDSFILGLSLCENASVTLLKNGKIISYIARERISGIKNHYGIDYKTIQICLKEANCNINQIHHCAIVAAGSNPALIEDWGQISIMDDDSTSNNSFVIEVFKKESLFSSKLQKIPEEIKKSIDIPSLQDKEWKLLKFNTFSEKNQFTYNNLNKNIWISINGYKIPGIFIYHHLAYACSSYYSSTFKDSLIFTHDSSTANNSGAFFKGKNSFIKSLGFHNLESLYSYKYTANKCGIDCSDSAASKFMALSSYGKNLLGSTIQLRTSIKPKNNTVNFEVSRAAFAAQKKLEKSIIEEIRSFNLNLPISSNLCLGGPIVLNCHLNSALWKSNIFQDIHIGPYSDEAGLSIGAAQYLYYQMLKNKRPIESTLLTSQSAMLGINYLNNEITSIFDKFHKEIIFTKINNLPEKAAIDLSRNKIIGIFRSRSEIGARALGHRSLLANPCNLHNIDLMNVIKEKKQWSPYAAIILEEELFEWFEEGPIKSPFLHYVYKVKEDKFSQIPTVVHIDGTARLQTVTHADGNIHALIKEFRRLQGIPLVMKSSLNKPGNPVVESPHDAIQFFLNSPTDVLYINNFRIKKRPDFIKKKG